MDSVLVNGSEALTLAQEFSHPYNLAYILICAASHHQFRREGRLARERAEAVITLSTEQGFPLYLALGTIVRGWALAEQGQVKEGIAQMQQGLVALRAMGTELNRPWVLAWLAEAYGKVGQVEEGLTLLAEALALVDKTGMCVGEGGLYVLKGWLLLASSRENKVDAEACFLRAQEIARRQQAKLPELQATMSLARLWQQQSKQKEAHQMLSEIYNWFTEGFDTKDLQEAKALLQELA